MLACEELLADAVVERSDTSSICLQLAGAFRDGVISSRRLNAAVEAEEEARNTPLSSSPTHPAARS